MTLRRGLANVVWQRNYVIWPQIFGEVFQKFHTETFVEMKTEELSQFPNEAWDRLKDTIRVDEVPEGDLVTNLRPDDVVRVVCVSDTHLKTSEMKYPVPDGDILIHAGDFSRRGHLVTILSPDFSKACSWLILPCIAHSHETELNGSRETL